MAACTEIANGEAESAALGHPSLGSTFRADLQAAGNSYEWTLAPAVLVEETTRRRAVGR